MPRSGDVVGGRYRMIEPMASGGMGTVWRAHHTELEVDVALKMMTPDAAAESSGHKRFRREAQAGAQLKSPHIVHVHDFGIHEDQPYLAMELLHGQDLQARLDESAPLPLELCAEIVEGVAKAIQLAHDNGIIHRDLKPGNIFLATQGDEKVPKVLDFGIAKDVTATPGSQNSTTGAGILGSPAYMSPEQVWGEALDHTTDLWSLGVVAFEMVVGVHPFADEKLPKTFDNIIHEDIPKPSDFHAELSPFDSFFERAFERNPKERIPSARAFADEFLDTVEATGTVSLSDLSPKTKPPSSRRSARRSGRGRSSATKGVDVGASTVDANRANAETIDAPKPVASRAEEGESPVAATATASASRPSSRRGWTTAAILGVAALIIGMAFLASSGPQEPSNAETGRPQSATGTGTGVDTPDDAEVVKEPAVGGTTLPSPSAAPPTTSTAASASKPPSPPPRVKTTGAGKMPSPPPASSASSEVDPLRNSDEEAVENGGRQGKVASGALVLGSAVSSNKLTPKKRALRSSYSSGTAPQSGTFPLGVIADPASVDATPIAFDRESFLARIEERRALGTNEHEARRKPFDPEVLCDLAMSRAETGALAAAEELVDRAIRVKPDYAFAYVFRATVRLSQEHYVAALADVGRALKIDPRCADAFRVRAQIHLVLEEPAEALTALDLAVRLASNDGEMFKLRALARERLGDVQGALSDAKIALGLEPEDAEAGVLRDRLRNLVG